MTRSVKALAVVAGLLLPAQAQAETYVYAYGPGYLGNEVLGLTRGGIPVDRLFFLKGDEFDITFRFPGGGLTVDNLIAFKTVVQDDTRISFRTIKTLNEGLALEPYSYGMEYGFQGASYRPRREGIDQIYGFNSLYCHRTTDGNVSDGACIKESVFKSFLYGETDTTYYTSTPRSTTYHVTVSSVPLPAAAGGLLTGLAALFGVARRRRG